MIVKMKKAKLIFLNEDKDKVLSLLQLNSLMMLDTPHFSNNYTDANKIKVSKAITILEKYLKKLSIGNNDIVSSDNFFKIDSNTFKIVDNILNKNDELEKLEENLKHYEKLALELNPYKEFNIPFSSLINRPYLKIFIGKISTEKEEAFIGQIQSLNLSYEIVNHVDDLTYFVVGVLKEDEIKLKEVMDLSQFNLDEIPNLSKSSLDVLNEYNNKINKLNEEILGLTNYFKEEVNSIGQIKLLYDQLLNLENKENIVPKETKDTIYFEGWIRSDQEKTLEKLLKKHKVKYELDLREPLEDELVPTALKNNKFVKPFENITNEFSVPNYKELDPNPIMSFWYWIIFGIMMGDVGYGLIMLFLFGFLLKFGKLKGTMKDLVNVFMYSGITATIAGLFFGSFLGFDLYPPVIDIINDPIPMLIISIAIGILHLITALIMKLILSIKQKDVLTGLSDAVSWISILIGISLVAIAMVLPDKQIGNILNISGLVLVIIGALLILFLNGRNEKKIFGKVMSGLGGLYGSTSYLSDILSYSRILALALSSGVIAMTFNILGDLVWNSIPVLGILLGLVVYIIGHVFNFVMGLLSAYVHTGRLQYLEFYGKFFEGGGYLYEPFQLKLKYLYEVTNNEKESLGGK